MKPLLLIVFLVLFTGAFSSSECRAVDTLEIFEMLKEAQRIRTLRDQELVRPSTEERAAVVRLLEWLPQPKTLNDADIKFYSHYLIHQPGLALSDASCMQFGRK